MVDRRQTTRPTLTYKACFILGGAVLAVITYFLGTTVYETEHLLASGQFFSRLNASLIFSNILQDHLLTFTVWVLGTMCLSGFVGYCFDNQVRYRQMAENFRARAEARAVTDGLTTVFNHRYFVEQLALEVKRAKRFRQSFVLLFLDIDGFKDYNDRHGHLAGDQVLKQVALTARSTVRETDLVARYGGEEFAIIATGTDKENGALLAERIRDSIQRKSPATVSIGVASFPQDGDSADEVLKAADLAMYEAKRHGKNCVYIAEKAAHAISPTTFQSAEPAY